MFQMLMSAWKKLTCAVNIVKIDQVRSFAFATIGIIICRTMVVNVFAKTKVEKTFYNTFNKLYQCQGCHMYKTYMYIDTPYIFFAHGQSIWNITLDGKNFQLKRASLQKTAMIDIDAKVITV